MEANLNTLIGSGGLLGVVYLIFRAGLFFGQFKSFSIRTDKSLDELKTDMKSVKEGLAHIAERISHLEGQMQGSFSERGLIEIAKWNQSQKQANQ